MISVENSAEAIERWKKQPELDAWMTYSSWHNRLAFETDLVRLDHARTHYQGTPMALATRSTEKDAAKAFVQFLHTSEAHAIFIKWGWE